MVVHTDCRFYRGDLPCAPHKNEGVHCESCSYYEPFKEQILIIKLGAIGDVIRSTPLLQKLNEKFPSAKIHWLTQTPEVVPSSVDHVYRFIPEDVEILKAISFDFLYNLDKDREACALANEIKAKSKYGFKLLNGFCHPMNDRAKHKWITGLFDDENQKNVKSYPQEIFEICAFKFKGEEYILDVNEKRAWDLPEGKPVIGLNTGCGVRWQTRLWPDDYWVKLALSLNKAGYCVLFLGGEQEDEKNKKLAKTSGSLYMGHFSLSVFIDLMNQCDLIVTAVTMALHIALGLKKKIVLFNNIFNAHEFELYGRGVVVEPPTGCKGCFMNHCDKPCMELITPNRVESEMKNLLKI